MHRQFTILILGAQLLAGCGNDQVAPRGAGENPTPPRTSRETVEGPRGEMLSGEIGALVKDSKGQNATGDTGELPSDPAQLRIAARKALNEKRYDDVVAIADALAIITPGDAELFELRGLALMGRGENESGRADLESCCKKGRKSCCR